LSTVIFAYSNASNSHILQYQRARRTHNQIDSDVTVFQIVRASENHKKP